MRLFSVSILRRSIKSFLIKVNDTRKKVSIMKQTEKVLFLHHLAVLIFGMENVA